jgi:aminocarboxymuconate-semialdehyde decarboxylase
VNEVIQGATAGSASASDSRRVHRNGKSLVVDIHCHLNIPEADELMRPHLAGHLSLHSFSSPASDACNRQLFQRIGRKLNVIEERITDMDRLGIDVQAISPVPTHEALRR